MRIRFTTTTLKYLFASIAILFVALAIAGAIQRYTPVPYLDMLNGYLGFYVRLTNGDWSAWWAQHNEHRIVLSHLIFWVDIAWLGGNKWFLLAINYLLIALNAFVFWRIWQERTDNRYDYVGFFLAAWLFSWCQSQNLVYAFQSAFILAQLLPLCGFYFLYRAAVREYRSTWMFVAAVACGALSSGSMVNGVLALPLMTLYSILVRMRWQRIAVLAAVSIATLCLYFHGYELPEHGHPLRTLVEHPVEAALYVLFYIGGPVYYLVGGGNAARFVAWVAGFAFVASTIVSAWHFIPRAKRAILELALLIFIAYIGCSAVAVAGGRLLVGMQFAVSSRYMTPALMAWAALLVLYAPALESFDRRSRGRLWMPFLLVAIAMVPQQLGALHRPVERLFSYKISTLALALDINDVGTISRTWFFNAGQALSQSKEARERGLGIFGKPPFRNAVQLINSKFSGKISNRRCLGQVDMTDGIRQAPGYIRISGWFYDRAHESVPASIQFINRKGTVLGVALTGGPRLDAAHRLGSPPRLSGFAGYILARTQQQVITVVDPRSGCRFDAPVPLVPYTVSRAPLQAGSVSVNVDQLAAGNQWPQDKSQRQPGLVIFSSATPGASSTGSLTLHIQRGDRLMYLSGKGGNQTLSILIPGSPPITKQLPVVHRWVQLHISNALLPPTFLVKFDDRGKRRDEWSAIALRASP